MFGQSPKKRTCQTKCDFMSHFMHQSTQNGANSHFKIDLHDLHNVWHCQLQDNIPNADSSAQNISFTSFTLFFASPTLSTTCAQPQNQSQSSETWKHTFWQQHWRRPNLDLLTTFKRAHCKISWQQTLISWQFAKRFMKAAKRLF